uniref:Uncharacterized protein n=1 Tax=Triticum urartu TaxID=4572 RepID=A0A8R7P8N5_TRIUA
MTVTRAEGFFPAGWDPNPRRALEQQRQLVSSTLQDLCTDYAAGLISAPVCSFFSSSLTRLALVGSEYERIQRFSKEQEDALELLSSLQQLELRNSTTFRHFLQGCTSLPALRY